MSDTGNSDLIKAATNGNLETVVDLLARSDVNKNCKDRTGTAPLIWAAIYGHLEIVKVLINAKAGVNIQNNSGTTALMHAAAHGFVEVVKVLLQAKADVNLQHREGDTALIYAALKNHVAVVRLLLQAGARVDFQNKEGKTALSSTTNEEIKTLLRFAESPPPPAPVPVPAPAPVLSLTEQGKQLLAHVAGVQARREWMQRRDALQAQYDAAESDLQYAECAKLWQDITAHEKLSESLVLSVEDYRTLGERHKKLVAAVEAECESLLTAKKYSELDASSALLSVLQGIDANSLTFPAQPHNKQATSSDKKGAQSGAFSFFSSFNRSGAAPATKTVVNHVAALAQQFQLILSKQQAVLEKHQQLLIQYRALATQCLGVPAREEWMQRRASLQAELDAAEKTKQFAKCAKLGTECIALDAESAKLALSAEDYRTLGERHAQLVSQHKQLDGEHLQLADLVQQAKLDLDKGRRELLAVKDFTGLDAMAELLTQLNALKFTPLPPLPAVVLPTVASVPKIDKAVTTPETVTEPAPITAEAGNDDVKLPYTADPVCVTSADPKMVDGSGGCCVVM